jgi:hypothetical protein
MVRRVVTLALCAAAGLACANHVRFDDELREHESRDVTRAVTRIEPPAPVVASPAVDLAVAVDETVLVRRRETIVHLDEETPWRGRNELWEVPTGVVAVPFFIGVRASNKLCLGLIPQSFIDDGLDFAFAALNPALNVEAPDRVRGREVSRKTHELESEVEKSTRPLAGVPVAVSLTPKARLGLETDPAGRIHIDLLALVQGAPEVAPRILRVEVPGASGRTAAAVELPLSGLIRARLVEGARERAAARAPDASAETAARALEALAALGFRDSAQVLERELRASREANTVWLSRLDFALSE